VLAPKKQWGQLNSARWGGTEKTLGGGAKLVASRSVRARVGGTRLRGHHNLRQKSMATPNSHCLCSVTTKEKTKEGGAGCLQGLKPSDGVRPAGEPTHLVARPPGCLLKAEKSLQRRGGYDLEGEAPTGEWAERIHLLIPQGLLRGEGNRLEGVPTENAGRRDPTVL